MHKAQISILSMLRHVKAARFTTLMRPTGMQSDTFKFHLKKLVHLGYVERSAAAQYTLTAKGKEFANNLDETSRTIQRQPKLSVLLIVPKPDEDGAVFLFQQRRRNPYFGFWSCIGGPVQWGENAEQVAARELDKQTGLSAVCTVRAFYRKRDYLKGSDFLLEDKLFIILEAADVRGEPSSTWYAGHNAWMSLDDYKKQPEYFTSVCDAISMIKSEQTYATRNAYYGLGEY